MIRIPRASAKAGGTDIIRIVLETDSGLISDIADQRIKTAAGPIIEVSVQRSTKAVRQRFPGMMAEARERNG